MEIERRYQRTSRIDPKKKVFKAGFERMVMGGSVTNVSMQRAERNGAKPLALGVQATLVDTTGA